MIRIGTDISDGEALTCDVCIIGSGAGGSVLAAKLASSGRSVIVLEEGGYFQRKDFAKPDERWSYPELYQERGARATEDLGITILQGRAVGGTTVVNWTTCYRTPERVLDQWRRAHGIELTRERLQSHFEAVETRLNIHRWPLPPNANNDALKRGCEALGWEYGILRRNVKGCANSGFCGLGCPVDAKQAMHLTYLADAVESGATVLADVRAMQLERQGGTVKRVLATVMERGKNRPTSKQISVQARVFVSSGGAINGPALLLRSGLDGRGRVGRRTFLHPVIAVLGEYPDEVRPYYGAPQSVGSHEFIERPGEYGFFLEAAPLQPMLAASAGWAYGADLNRLMSRLSHTSGLLALHVDGWLEGDEGGTVSLKSDGRIRVDYPVGAKLAEAMRASHIALARVHLAAGATRVLTTHPNAVELESDADLQRLESASYGTHAHGIFTAHQMGGLSMGADPKRHPVDLDFRFRGVDNLFVVDGSVLPTALGVNPSETIYGLSHFASAEVDAAL